MGRLGRPGPGGSGWGPSPITVVLLVVRPVAPQPARGAVGTGAAGRGLGSVLPFVVAGAGVRPVGTVPVVGGLAAVGGLRVVGPLG